MSVVERKFFDLVRAPVHDLHAELRVNVFYHMRRKNNPWPAPQHMIPQGSCTGHS